MFSEEAKSVQDEVSRQKKRTDVLQNVDVFVLDNSIRESTVGQLRGHTLENKFKIFEEVKKCGIKHIVVAAFSHSPRVDDKFVKELLDRGEDMSCLYGFTEVSAGVENGGLDRDRIPEALKKMKELKLPNPIIEIDLADSRVDWEKTFTVDDMCQLLHTRIKWVHDNLSPEAKVFINLRDFPFAMQKCVERVLTVVGYLASLSTNLRPSGLLYEEPTGRFLVGEMIAWTAGIRSVMNQKGWQSGHLLVHVHQKWGLAETVQLECLSAGADGVWASLCEEGAATGHACSTITLMNLIRLGNQKVLKKYNCTYLRTAAKNITNYTTGGDPHPKQIVYGDRAMDMVFDLEGIAGGRDDFDLGGFFNVERPIRISTLSTPALLVKRMRYLFGDNPQFTEERAEEMKRVMIQDLTENRKEEYMSEAGLAILFDRSGGALDAKMRDVIEKMEVQSKLAEFLIKEVRKIWDEWDLKEAEDKQGDDALEFDSFYNGFMVPFFGCFRCDDTRKGLQAIDMDNDGTVDWSEFLVYLKWALHEYPSISNADELLSVTFRKGLIPAMQDEVLHNKLQ